MNLQLQFYTVRTVEVPHRHPIAARKEPNGLIVVAELFSPLSKEARNLPLVPGIVRIRPKSCQSEPSRGHDGQICMCSVQLLVVFEGVGVQNM